MDDPERPLSEPLRELCRRLAEAEDLDGGVEAVAWTCDGWFPFYRVSLVLPGRGRHRYYVAAAWARRPEEELQGYDFSIDGHPLARVADEGVTLVRTDPLGDHDCSSLARLFRDEEKAEELAVPLVLGGRRGMLVFASRESGVFGERARARAEDVAGLLSLWVRPWAGPEAPEALRAQYETLLEGALDGIAVLVEGRIVYANGSFREIFGIDPGRAPRSGFEALLDPGSRPAFADALSSLDRLPRVLPRLEVRARSAGRSELFLDVGLQRIWFRGQPAVLVQVHNATPRAEREQEARALFERVDGLLHTLAHDIRAPLTTVIGYAELLAERFPDLGASRVREMLGLVARSGRTLKDLVEGLLEYSALGRRVATPAPVALEPLLGRIESELEGLLHATGGRIWYRAVPPVVWGRGVEVGRVFRNLLENALKYARPGTPPEVSVACTGEEGRYYVFRVEDNGAGIAPDRVGEVFELFRRGDGGGAGVGLAIVDRIVRGHGGRVWVESRPQEGSAFYFTLPKPPESSA